jgi:SecD/SecF fusion protein
VPLELRKRIDTLLNLTFKIGESGQILVELPGAKDVDRIKKLLQSTAQLEFGKRTRLKKWVIS